jgi:hypothetical protein
MAIDKIFDNASVDGIADNLFKSVSNSVSEVKAMQQRKAAENVQLVIQALKKIESDIQDKYDGVTTVIAKRVSSIKDGQDGRNGVDGRAGKDGRPGRDGAAGPRGIDGINGVNGVDGDDGVSVVDAHIDFDGSLIIGLSSGRAINVGEVVAPDLAEKIKVITNGGGTSQQVLDTLVSLQNQINAILTGITYQGTWNASTNTPTLTSSAGTTNGFYIVSVSGSTTLNGISNWGVGDWAIFNGTVWQRVEGGSSGNFVDLSVSGTTTLSGLTASTALALDASKNVVSVTNTGTGNNVLATSPTLVTPALGTPSSGTVTNLTGTASININGTVGATTPATASVTTLTTSSTVTHNGGTANGVTYLNGSKVLTSGSTFVFDGTNVGIGTSSPSSWGKFAVQGTASGSQVVSAIVNTSGTANSQTVLSFDAGASGFNVRDSQIRATNNGSNQTSLEFYTANAATPVERMRIDSSGNVGIGTSSPGTYSAKLAVVSTAADTRISVIDDAANSRGGYLRSNFSDAVILGTSSGVRDLVFSPDNTERMRINTTGNVGIGTSSPSSKFDVVGGRSTFAANSENFSVYLRYNSSTNGFYIGSPSVDAMAFSASSGAERMRIASDGSVGIGTSSPSASAILDAQSTTKGVRMPNMTTTQKNAISSPAAGLMVFDTTLAKLCVYSGSAWQTITSV